MLKIAMTSYYLPSESKIGAGYQAHYMANALVRRGHEVTMFTPCRRPEDALYDVRNVYVGRAMRTFRFAWELRRADFGGFDVLHAHGDDYWLWRRRVPCHVRTVHGSCLAEAFNIPGVKEKVRMLALAAGESLATIVADRAFGVSANTLRYFPWMNDYIYNGVDLSAFRPAEQKEAAPTILFVGTYRNRKRGAFLMDAFQRQIRPAMPEAKLWMVCDDAPVAEGVEVLGRISLEELADRYRRAWVFCLPSTYEGFGVPYIEAMASGTAVVTTPNVGAKEVLGGGRFGVLVEDGQLGDALLGVLGDRTERERWEGIGLERARDFDWDRILEQYEKVYLGELGARAPRAKLTT